MTSGSSLHTVFCMDPACPFTSVWRLLCSCQKIAHLSTFQWCVNYANRTQDAGKGASNSVSCLCRELRLVPYGICLPASALVCRQPFRKQDARTTGNSENLFSVHQIAKVLLSLGERTMDSADQMKPPQGQVRVTGPQTVPPDEDEDHLTVQRLFVFTVSRLCHYNRNNLYCILF